MPGWWTAHQSLWARELDALRATGWDWRVEETAADRGMIAIRVDYPVPAAYTAYVGPTDTEDGGADPPDGTPGVAVVPLRVRFPPSYPWFPPEVQDPTHRLRLPRHRQPVTGDLCLVHRRDWRLTSTAAELLQEQMPRLLAAATAPDRPPGGLEDPTPEPVGHTLVHAVGTVLVDSTLTVPTDHRQGALLVGFTQLIDDSPGTGAVKMVQAGNEWLELFPTRLTDQFPRNALGPWLRWDGYQPGMSAAEIWDQVEPLLQPLRVVDTTGARVELAADLGVLGLLIPSETTYRQPGEEWLFVVRRRAHRTPVARHDPEDTGTDTSPSAEAGPPPTTPPATGTAPAPGWWRYRLYRSAAAGRADVLARTPATAGLQDKRVLVVGVGALGGTVGLDLARAGVAHLDLVDGDTVDPATGCRQTAPVIYAGFAKVVVLRQLLAETTPHVRVAAHIATLGRAEVAPDGQPDPHSAVAHLIRHADLVVDTAADPAVSRYLAALARATRRPFLHVAGTAGAYGGVIALIRPDRGGCWWCLLHHRHDQTIPFPPAADPAATRVVPAGCTDTTFTGTGADLTTIAAQAARTAIDLLTGDHAMTLAGSTVYVGALRDHHGRPRPVRWRTRRLRRHPDCPMHQPPPGSDAPGQDPVGAATAPQTPATDGGPRRRSEPADRAGPHLDNTTEETTKHAPAGATGRGGAHSESGPT